MEIRRIQEVVQKISEAIAAVLNCNVTIIDTQLIRVAGTGPYKSEIKNQAPKGSAFEKSLLKKETIIIEKPRLEKMCQGCENISFCSETFEICAPIFWQNQVLGVIGIFAYNETQRKHLISIKDDVLVFLKKMSELIGSKVGEQILLENIEATNKELMAVVQNVNNGVINVNQFGKIQHINEKALKLLNISKKVEEVVEKNIQDIWSDHFIIEALSSQQDVVDYTSDLRRGGHKKSLLTTIRLIHMEEQVKSAVITFTDMENIQKSAFRHRESQQNFTFDTLIGASRSFVKVKEQAKKIATIDSTVLITGESGTGKELFARAIHHASQRQSQPFISINCSAIPESLLESELFGYEGGAFTGASQKGKPGKLELAHKGTFFLDEIGDMSLFLQAKLLRVLQDRCITRIGGIETKSVDIRLVSATNKNLEELIEKRMFREDLYYRLNVIPIKLPSLAQRKEDIALLISHFLHLYNARFQKSIEGFTEEAMTYLENYHWPGNVRELENIVEYGVSLAEGPVILLDDIKERCVVNHKENNDTLKDLMQSYEGKIIKEQLDHYGWSEMGKAQVAKKLGISRATLYRKISQI